MIRYLYGVFLLLTSIHTFAAELSIKSSEIVSAMYKEYAWYPMMKESPLKFKPLHLADRETLEVYFTKKLTELILNNQSCVAETLVDGCTYSGNIIYPEKALKVSDLVVFSPSDELVLVKYINPVTTENVVIRYEMVKLNNRWVIEDVRYINGDSLYRLLENK